MVGIGVGRGRHIFGRKTAWMLGERGCTEICHATMGVDGGFGEMATWKMTAVERSSFSKVCLGVFRWFLVDFI